MEKVNQTAESITPNEKALKSWVQKYMDEDGDYVTPESDIILALGSDQLDYDAIEDRVQKLVPDADVSGGFCAKCRHLIHHWPDLNTTDDWDRCIAKHVHTEELEACARAGCKFCLFIMSRFKLKNKLLDTFRKVEARLAAVNNPALASLSIENWGGLGGSGAINQLLWFNFPGKESTHCNHDSCHVKFVSQVQPINNSTWEEPIESMSLARMWLSECCKTHKPCNKAPEKSEWPARLISFDGDHKAKIIETASLDSLPRYATLSYRWGRVPFFKLTPDTEAELLEGVLLEKFAQTFQDAITVAKEFGLDHIWIDSLCIIQDENDHSDWLRESGRMRSVYGFSYATLAATSASNVDQGFLAASLRPKYTGGFYARVLASTFSRVQNFHSLDVYEESCTKTPLAERAWAFQEKLLSPRTISFGDHGIFWECRSSSKSEFLPDGFKGHLGSSLIETEDRAWHWADIVANYSGTQLTYPSDRLPALSGIVSRQHKNTGDKYLAGLWEKDLFFNLAWYVDPDTSLTKRPEWCAPTWSWASIGSRCIPFQSFGLLKTEARLLNAWTKPSGDDPFGAVCDGELTLACTYIVSAQLDNTGSNRSVGHTESTDEASKTRQLATVLFQGSNLPPMPVHVDCAEEETLEQVYLLPVFSDKTGAKVSVSGEPLPDKIVEGYVFETDEDDAVWEVELSFRGLILRRTPETPNHFTRVGAFEFSSMPTDMSPWYKGAERNLYVEFNRILEEQGEETARSVCARTESSEEHPEQRFVIIIK